MEFLIILFTIVILYIIWLFITIMLIPEENWDEYRKFKGSGKGIKINKDGDIESVSYKTTEDTKRFLSGIRTLK